LTVENRFGMRVSTLNFFRRCLRAFFACRTRSFASGLKPTTSVSDFFPTGMTILPSLRIKGDRILFYGFDLGNHNYPKKIIFLYFTFIKFIDYFE